MFALFLSLLLAAEPADAFAKAQPVFTAHCIKCHNAEKPRAGLDLTAAAKALAGSKSGPVLTAGKPDESLIVQVLAAGHETHMPPEKQLTAAEIESIASWVKSLPPAAVAPRKEMQVTERDRDYWAFRPVKAISPSRKAKPIDAFILAGLESKGLTLSPEADRRTLIRRLTFDLIGLPATPEEIDAFVADQSTNAYEKLIDRLLASPHYGERWARHWLDLARFADADTPELGAPRNDPGGASYHYRDYVIRSFNADKPFNRFLMEQVAGDELAPGDREALIATAFLRLGPPSGAEGEKAKLDDLDDTLSATSAVFLGLTVGCARCHDHKTDPIPQRDYYRLLAVFAATERRATPVPSNEEKKLTDAASAARAAELEELRKRLTGLQEFTKDQREEDEVPPTDFVGPPTSSRWYRARLREAEQMQERINNMDSEQPRLPTALTASDSTRSPPAMHLLLRGDPRAKTDVVTPGVPTVLTNSAVTFANPPDGAATSGRRLALAKWLAQPEHPLTARVLVNRVWHYHFGRGIVASPSNFGPGGDRPTHPELLDWLADRFVKDGWSIKQLHRHIVTSATYRQSSVISQAAKEKDPDNRLWSRFPRRRLEAEALRDALLFTAGRLNPAMFGPGGRARPSDMALAPEAARSPQAVREGPQQSRRSIYLYVNRGSPSVLLESFDAPPPACPCEKRVQTTVPPQALLLLNGPMVLEMAGHLALRVKADAGGDPTKQVDRLFQIALGRPPRAVEREKALKFLADPVLRGRPSAKRGAEEAGPLGDLAHVLLNTNEFIYVD